MTIRTVSLMTHNDPALTSVVLPTIVEHARAAGVALVANADERSRHGFGNSSEVGFEEGSTPDVRLCLGGDGTVLRGLRASAGTDVPVFGINFGEVGFLAACDPDGSGLEDALERAFSGSFDRLELPALAVGIEGLPVAFNDVSAQRRAGLRIADVAYSIGGEEVGRVRCDGVVVATPAGSTGYNLANGGPVVAWGVEGFVVSFIAPHSLNARSLVVAPDDEVHLINMSNNEPVDLLIDGRPMSELGPGESVGIQFKRAMAQLAQMPESSFYQRLREKFGRLAS